MQFRGAFYPASLFLICFLVKIQETAGEGNNTDQLQSSKAHVLKDISIDHSNSCNSTNASSCSESRNDTTNCPKDMFSPGKNVCASCTEKCPPLMYISTPCSPEMDTQCSKCPLLLETRFWDINMNNTCIAERDKWNKKKLISSITGIINLFLTIFILGLICVIYMLRCIKTRIDYSPVASSDNEESFVGYGQIELITIPTEDKETIMEPRKSKNGVCDGSVQRVDADVELNLCNKQSTVNDINNMSRREFDASASSRDLSQMFDTCHRPPPTMEGSQECFVESHSDTSSASSIMATATFNLTCRPPSPDRNGKSFLSSCHVMRQSSVLVMNERPDPPQYVSGQSSDVPNLTDHSDICMNLPREILHVKASLYKHSNGSLENIPRTPILDRGLNVLYSSSSSLTSERSSIVGDVRVEKTLDVV